MARVSCADAALGIDHQRHHVGVVGALPGGGDHGALEPALGDAEDARRVDQHDLRRGRPSRQVGHGDADHPHARGLHLARDDGDLGADQGVDQRRLAGIGRADDGDEPGAGLRCAHGSVPIVRAAPARPRRSASRLLPPRPCSAGMAPDRDLDHEHRRVRRAFAADLAIGRRRQAARLRPFLQRRLGVARRGGAAVQPVVPQPLDDAGGRCEAGIEEDRAQQRLQRVGQDGRLDARACARSRIAKSEMRAEPDRLGDLDQGAARSPGRRGAAPARLRVRAGKRRSSRSAMASDSTRSPRNSSRSLPCGKAALRSGRRSSALRWVSASAASSTRAKACPTPSASAARSTSLGFSGSP